MNYEFWFVCLYARRVFLGFELIRQVSPLLHTTADVAQPNAIASLS